MAVNDDIDLIVLLGEEYTRMTGRPVRPSSTHPTRHRYGTLISWAYWDRGIIGWVPEYWPGISADYNGDGRTDEREELRFNDEELGGRYFVDWQSYNHPEFGQVEIGGWRRMFTSQNPPAELLEEECVLQIPWILYLAEQSPFESMAKTYSLVILNNNLNDRLSLMNRLIREFQVDGLIIHSARSCKPYSVGQYDLKRLLMDRLGVPSVVIEADITDSRAFSEESTPTS